MEALGAPVSLRAQGRLAHFVQIADSSFWRWLKCGVNKQEKRICWLKVELFSQEFRYSGEGAYSSELELALLQLRGTTCVLEEYDDSRRKSGNV